MFLGKCLKYHLVFRFLSFRKPTQFAQKDIKRGRLFLLLPCGCKVLGFIFYVWQMEKLTRKLQIQHEILEYLNHQQVKRFPELTKETIFAVVFKYTPHQFDEAYNELMSDDCIVDRDGRIKMGDNGDTRHDQLYKLVNSQKSFIERAEAWLKEHWVIKYTLRVIFWLLLMFVGAAAPIITDMERAAIPKGLKERIQISEPTKEDSHTIQKHP
jgi:hypothetical protein